MEIKDLPRAERRRLAKHGNVNGKIATPTKADEMVMMLKAMSIVLHDEYGFGAKRCANVVQRVVDMFDHVRTGHLSGADINFMFNMIGNLHIDVK
jgi:hypothetical protein